VNCIRTALTGFCKRVARRLFCDRFWRYERIDGFLTLADAKCLYATARKLRPGSTVVEIGSWKGKSTYCLARGLRGGRIIAIDPFDASGEPDSSEVYHNSQNGDLYGSFCRTMAVMGVADKVEAWKGTSRDFIDRIPEIDLLFIDGDHSIDGCRFDYEHYASRVAKGGYLLFHDYQPGRPDLGPTWVINNFVLPSRLFSLVETAGSVWVGKKI